MWGDEGSERDDLVPVPQGVAYRVDSPPANAMVRAELARELSIVLERFAQESGFGPERRVGIFFRPGIFGHHRAGRAADIYGVGKFGIEHWKRLWDLSHGKADERELQKVSNLGWRVYKALQKYGRWSQPYGYPIQLFGPWTRTEGPWKYISDFLLRAHRDHIHVAK